LNHQDTGEIVVPGFLHIGELRERVAQVARAPSRRLNTVRPEYLPLYASLPPQHNNGLIEGAPITYALRPQPGAALIEGAGLKTSYGIFGASGSGKSHLLVYLLTQIFELNSADPRMKYGGLIVDPKAVLRDKIREIARRAGREHDLIVLNTDELNGAGEAYNVIDIGTGEGDIYELGKQIVRAARASGAGGASDQFWSLAWRNLFGPASYLLRRDPTRALTLRLFMDELINREPSEEEPDKRVRPILNRAIRRARELQARAEDAGLSPEEEDELKAAEEVQNFYAQDQESIGTIEQLVTDAYTTFRMSRYRCFSPAGSKQALAARRPSQWTSLYDQIIEEGKIVLVSLSPGEPTQAKLLCTLIKSLFQRKVLTRKDRWLEDMRRNQGRSQRNFCRPLLLFCDEYHEVATELPGEADGDGLFFSQSREQGCMSLIATQSVHMLKRSSLGEHWGAVFSTLGAQIFLRLADNETIEAAVKLAGKLRVEDQTRGQSYSDQGSGINHNSSLQERDAVPSQLLTQVFAKGDAVILGSLDGSQTPAVIRYVHVPGDFDTFRRIRVDEERGRGNR
jgi:hypothetical protein